MDLDDLDRFRVPPSIVLIFSGAGTALCLPKPGLCPAAWFLSAPLFFLVWRTAGAKKSAWFGWLFGMGLCGTAFYWVYSTCRFAGVPIPVSFSAWAALAAALSFQWSVFSAAARLACGKVPLWIRPWACACLWAALEFAISNCNLGLMKLAYTQWRFPSWLQAGSWAGPEALGFLIILVNAGLASSISSPRPSPIKGRERPLFSPPEGEGMASGKSAFFLLGNGSMSGFVKAMAPIMLLTSFWWGYGVWVLGRRPMSGPTFTAAIVQPNVDQYRKWDARYARDIRENIDDLMKTLASRQREAGDIPKMVVWPESSVPGRLEDAENLKWVTAIAKRTGMHQIVGVLTRISDAENNSAALISPEGRIEGLYHKRRLVPFGEFVPLRRLFAPWIGILDQMGDFGPGPERQAPLATPAGKIGVTICYEAMFPPLVRATLTGGANFLANLTNDGWYKDTWGPYQHFYANIFRAVENRVTILRAANTGISGVIDPYGIVTARLDLEKRGILFAQISAQDPFPGGSFYNRWGDWFGWANLAAALLLLSGLAKRRS